MKMRTFLCTYTCLPSSTVMLSDTQHISFCFFPTFLFLLSPSCWIVDISADWQYEGKKNKKQNKTENNLFPFLSVWCVFCHCASLLTPLTPPEMAAGGHTCHYCREQSSPLNVQSCLLPSPLFPPHFIPAEQ